MSKDIKEWPKIRVGELDIFLDIVCEQHKIYSNFIYKRPSIDPFEQLDIKNPLDVEKAISFNAQQIDPLYISTIFSALFLEAYIYDYGVRKSSKSYIETYIDRISPQAKWVVVTQLFNSKGIDPSLNAYEKIDKLFKYRNHLAHNKTAEFKSFDVPENEKRKPRILTPSECIDTIISVMEELLTIDKDDHKAKRIIEKLKKLIGIYPV